RKINPNAKLVQTEDLGKTYSTPVLEYQAQFENSRRWLTYDFLFGKIDECHPMYSYFLSLGFSKDELSFLLTDHCPPEIVGVNYYVTSERFLDDRIELYPFAARGGNGKHEYVDVEAIRISHNAEHGLKVLLAECWQRYQTDIAITEVHLNASREQQLRWFQRALDAAERLNGEGMRIKAVTAWALLGAFGWDRLVTEPGGRYENGVFDVRSGKPRPTALSRLITSYNRNKLERHPVVDGQGWWEKSSRFFHGKPSPYCKPSDCRPVLIISKEEGLGTAVAEACLDRSINYHLVTPPQTEVPGIAHIEQAIEKTDPWAIIYVAEYGDVDGAETDVERCNRENVELPFQIARACNRNGIQLLTFSSDLVFDGRQKTPYVEHDDVSPINVYGESKAKGEAGILSVFGDALIVRASAVFGTGDAGNYAGKIIADLEKERRVPVADNITVSPTYVPDLINASLDLLIDGENSIWHLCNSGSVTWADFATAIASRTRKDTKLLIPTSGAGFKAPRPAFSVLNTVKGVVLPSLENAIDRYCETISCLKA
ncbi:MAG TPA: NAD(P)-dependent oxidoreductase, partial [Chitinophagaceae bacterium]